MKSLFDETKIGQLTLKNRLIRAAIGDKTQDNKPDDEIIETYTKQAKGGIGTIITGFTLVDEVEKYNSITGIFSDDFIPHHKKLVEAIHKSEVNAIIQLVYIGSYLMSDSGDVVPLAPSAVKNRKSNKVPREATVDEIKKIQQKFAQAALRAKQAGYDGVELHGAHGFFLSQFMTPYYNKRTDCYGGSVENRARMLLETYQTVRNAVGNEYPVWVKINTWESGEEGISLNDVIYLSKELVKGGIGAIEMSGDFLSRGSMTEPFFKEEALGILREVPNAVLILTGNTKDFKDTTALLNSTPISYFGIARALIENPELINEWKKESS
jgi:2,4-dienoyl-CoA reductase-like NADH-dependent reductase (Old Yellow Enzyme family)